MAAYSTRQANPLNEGISTLSVFSKKRKRDSYPAIIHEIYMSDGSPVGIITYIWRDADPKGYNDAFGDDSHFTPILDDDTAIRSEIIRLSAPRAETRKETAIRQKQLFEKVDNFVRAKLPVWEVVALDCPDLKVMRFQASDAYAADQLARRYLEEWGFSVPLILRLRIRRTSDKSESREVSNHANG